MVTNETHKTLTETNRNILVREVSELDLEIISYIYSEESNPEKDLRYFNHLFLSRESATL